MQALWAKALEAAKAAHVLFATGDCNGATNRAYYAMFDAARTLLRQNQKMNSDVMRKHATTIGQFSLFYVHTGILGKEHGRAINNAFNEKSRGDYSDMSIFQDDAASVLADMDAFLAAVAPLLDEHPAS